MAVLRKIYYTATILSCFPLHYQILNWAKIVLFHDLHPLRIYYLNCWRGIMYSEGAFLFWTLIRMHKINKPFKLYKHFNCMWAQYQ